jgi:hypothetical protein
MLQEFLLIIRMLFIIIFFSSIIYKVRSFYVHLHAIESYRVLPVNFIKPFAIIGITLESFIFISMLLGFYIVLFSVLAILLLLIYTVGISINVIKETNIDCGCGGFLGNHKISWLFVIRNIILVLLLLPLLIFESLWLSIDSYVLHNNIFNINILPTIALFLTLVVLYKNFILFKNSVLNAKESA